MCMFVRRPARCYVRFAPRPLARPVHAFDFFPANHASGGRGGSAEPLVFASLGRAAGGCPRRRWWRRWGSIHRRDAHQDFPTPSCAPIHAFLLFPLLLLGGRGGALDPPFLGNSSCAALASQKDDERREHVCAGDLGENGCVKGSWLAVKTHVKKSPVRSERWNKDHVGFLKGLGIPQVLHLASPGALLVILGATGAGRRLRSPCEIILNGNALGYILPTCSGLWRLEVVCSVTCTCPQALYHRRRRRRRRRRRHPPPCPPPAAAAVVVVVRHRRRGPWVAGSGPPVYVPCCRSAARGAAIVSAPGWSRSCASVLLLEPTSRRRGCARIGVHQLRPCQTVSSG